jgi:hypothetical protein
VVGSVLESNLQAGCIAVDVEVGGTPPCINPAHADYAQWVLVGEPASWCGATQCSGNADDAKEQIGKGQFLVGYNDIAILLEGFGKAYTNQGWIAADFTRTDEQIGKGRFRVGYADINVLLAYFGKADGLVPANCSRY